MSTDNRSSLQEWWLTFFNSLLYDRMPGVYNALDTLTFGVWWRLVSRALDYVPQGQCVLEIGFGPGKLLVRLAERSQTAVGLDLAAGMCRFTYRRLVRNDYIPCVTRGSAFHLPYPARTFDVMVSTFALSGLPDAGMVLQEMVRVAAPGGRIVIVDIGLPSDGNAVGTFWARLWERMGDFLYDWPRLMEQSGLTVTTLDEFGPGQHIRAVVGEIK